MRNTPGCLGLQWPLGPIHMGDKGFRPGGACLLPQPGLFWDLWMGTIPGAWCKAVVLRNPNVATLRRDPAVLGSRALCSMERDVAGLSAVIFQQGEICHGLGATKAACPATRPDSHTACWDNKHMARALQTLRGNCSGKHALEGWSSPYSGKSGPLWPKVWRKVRSQWANIGPYTGVDLAGITLPWAIIKK